MVEDPAVLKRTVRGRCPTSRTRLIALFLGISFFWPVYGWPEQIGSPAPLFELADANGKKVRLEDFAGKVLLLNFWAPWCASCRIELPLLEALHRKYAGGGLSVVGISEDASAKGTMEAAKKSGLSYPILIDQKETVSDAFRVSGLPTTFIIDRAGVIRYRHVGFADEFRFLYEEELSKLLKQ